MTARILVFTAILPVMCLAQKALDIQTTDNPDPNIWIDHDEVWMQTAAGPRQLTSASIPKRLPLLSPDGKRLVYIVDEPSPDIRRQPDQELIFEIEVDGKPLRRIIPKGYVPERFDRLDWIDGRRIGAMECGHANCMYWIIDADSGETLQVIVGGFDFVWSHDRRWVARKLVADTPVGEFETLKLNEAHIYPPRTDPDLIAWGYGHQPEHAHNLGPFTWSPHDAWVAFTDAQSIDEVYVVLANPSGVILRQRLPMFPKIGTAIEWVDDTHCRISVGAQTMKFVVVGSELQTTSAGE
jgi:hypothetical protein